jgi:tetratricopeptide (TPR) repeat protein
MLRGLARRVQPGTTLVGAVAFASVGQRLEAPARRAYSREALDALLVRTGWAAPVLLGRVDGFLVFETHRMEASAAHAALELAETLDPRHAAETVLLRIAGAARTNADASLARELMLATAALQLHRGDLDAADEAATAANAIAPSAARPLVVLGRIARARGAVDDAEALFDHALACDECNVDAWAEWSSCLEAQGNLDAAVETLACAASLEPADHTIAANEARLLGTAGQGHAAIRVLDRVLAYGGGVSAPLRTAMTWATANAAKRGGAARPITGVFTVPAEQRGGRDDRMAS